MTSEEPPNEITVLLKVLDIVELRLRNTGSRDLDQSEQNRLIQVFNQISSSTISGPLVETAIIEEGATVGDSYTVGQAGAVGPHSHAENVHFQQIWQQTASGISLVQLAEELQTLRAKMRQEADTPEEDLAVAEIGQAHIAAKEGDGPRSLSHLSRAGEWAFKVATGIGTAVAAAAIKSALGL